MPKPVMIPERSRIGELVNGPAAALAGVWAYGSPIAAAVIAVQGYEAGVLVAAAVVGTVAGYVALTLWLFVLNAMGHGEGPSKRAERSAVALLFVGPPAVAFGASLLTAAALTSVGVSLAIVAVVLVVVVAVAVVRHRMKVADQLAWLRSHDADLVRDSEFGERLRSRGWRPDGPYRQMERLYWDTLEAVRRDRRAAGRRIFVDERPEVTQADPDADP